MIFCGHAVFIAMCKKNNIGSFANDGCFPCSRKDCCSLCFSLQSAPWDFLASGVRSNVTVYMACPATIKLECVTVKRDGEGGTVTNVSVCWAFMEEGSGWCVCSSWIQSRWQDPCIPVLLCGVGLEVFTGMVAADLLEGVALHRPVWPLPHALTRIGCTIAACLSGHYGVGCAQRCRCPAGTPCHHLTGKCSCPPGFTGYGCEKSKFVIRMQILSL